MHLSLWNPLSHCVTLIIHKKTNVSGHDQPEPEPEHEPEQPDLKTAPTRAQLEFLEITAGANDHIYESEDSIPDINQAFSKFLIMYPDYGSTEEVDHIRSNEYLPKVCLDYCGFGLFSFVQTVHYWESCSFHLSEITANLINYAHAGGAVKGTVEHDIKTRILEYMNISEDEYEVVFTVSRGSAFKLLAESYPFQVKKKLLTMFDHESQSINWMCQFAKQRGAKVENAWFKWPTFQVCAADLRQQITGKKKKKKGSSASAGLFVFPVQSRVTGTKYSYQWMSLAQENNWHVLLDAGALGPKDMDSLGLSLFRPEFIITSFYKVFGYDPSGFGCLLIKKSMIGSLRNQPGHTGTGIVKINPVFPSYFSDSIEGSPGLTGPGPGLGIHGNGEVSENGSGPGPQMPVFSGAYTSDQVREVFDTEMEDDKYFELEETESFSVDEVLKSPVFSEDGSPNDPFWIDLGRSPAGSDSVSDPTQPGPPVWFTGMKKTEHECSPKTTLNVIKSPKVMLVNEIEEATKESKVVKEKSPKVGSNPESAIRRETEGEFRLLGRREVNILATNINEDIEYASEDIDVEELTRQEPEITCRHLDHVDKLGLHKTTLRLRYLVNWLVTSLLQLKIRSTDQVSVPLVHIYGPKVKFERGGAVAFNIRDKNKKLVNPETVQKLAETNGVSLGVAILSNIRVEGKDDVASGLVRVEVVTCSLGFLSDFSDVYKLWAFVAKFMNPGFMNGGLTTVVEDE